MGNILVTVKGRYISSPICLFYVNEKKLLVPIAIQLSTKIPYDPHLNPIFTPKDQDDPGSILTSLKNSYFRMVTCKNVLCQC